MLRVFAGDWLGATNRVGLIVVRRKFQSVLQLSMGPFAQAGHRQSLRSTMERVSKTTTPKDNLWSLFFIIEIADDVLDGALPP